ncbi:universal stress protein [Halopiger aswanensis]|uniref:Nucleotide-binding universal stress UspA family protein n=1 Tax=Halopiger aswanensis TaxID=148449 RepID=A0A419WID3_9EURY|nr:universal stress protein [Halopiger aswanensis]RKD95206.1 nucleotide-binding universal stress UspA family protein [Halopiger aswanensis]
MYRVLLPVADDPARARGQVEAVLELPQAASEVFVDVLHVHDEAATADAEWAAGGFAESYEAEMDELRELQRIPEAVETAIDRLEDAGLEYAVHEATGDPAETILARADEYDSDAIVVGVRKRSPVGKVLFGSVAQAVILDSDRPVTVVPAASEAA